LPPKVGDVTSAAVRGIRTLQWRDRQVVKTAGANVTAVALGYVIRLAVIPLSLKLLGSDLYGLWLAVGSLIAWGGVADLGLTPGLVNLVASACGQKDRTTARRHISTALWAYTILASLLLVAFLAASRWQQLPKILGITCPSMGKQAGVLVAVCGAIFALNSLTRLVPTVCTALQEGYYAPWSYIGGSLVSLAVLVLFWRSGVSLLTYALIVGIPPLAAQIGLGVYFFGRRHPDLCPRLEEWDRASLRDLWGLGGWLTLHQAANLAVLYSANLIIANRLGPTAVTQYSVPYAVFNVLISVAYYIVSPYLPAYAEASARGDLVWIRRRASQTLSLTAILVGGGSVVLLIAGQQGIRLWSGGQVDPSLELLGALACFSFLKACSNATGVLLVGLGRVRFAACVYTLVTIMYLTVAWFSMHWLGLLAIPVAGALAHACDVAVSFPFAIKYMQEQQLVSSGTASLNHHLQEKY